MLSAIYSLLSLHLVVNLYSYLELNSRICSHQGSVRIEVHTCFVGKNDFLSRLC